MIRSSSMPSAVLFDLDGTLIDTYLLYLESYRRAVAPFLGRSPEHDEIAARAPSAERRFLVDWIGDSDVDECHGALCRHYAELQASMGEGPYEGVREMLTALRTAGYPLGIVTGKGRRIWEVTEETFEPGTFEVVVTEDDVREPKPHPEGLLQAARELRTSPQRVVYIGDSVGDMAAGRAAGMSVGAALWPKTDPDDRADFLSRIDGYAPEWRFESPADVTRALAMWC